MSLHVFYAADADPLLVDCLRPLVNRLRRRELVSRSFFVRYWLEGPHVRLRLMCAPSVAPDAVVTAARAQIDGYLARHPSPSPPGAVREEPGTARRMFVAEYGQAAWDRTYGSTGAVPAWPNNSWRRDRYEPEYERYGGRAGMALAEKHFAVSSEVVLDLLAHRRMTPAVRLGWSLHLGLSLGLGLLGGGDELAGFLAGYRDFWLDWVRPGGERPYPQYDEAYRRTVDRVRERVDLVRAAISDGSDGDLLDPAGSAAQIVDWPGHCRALGRAVRELAAAGQIELRVPGGPSVAASPERALPALLHSYVHMTNNRLGLTVLDEAYVAHLLRRALLEARSPLHVVHRR